jgi:hypothetical protein
VGACSQPKTAFVCGNDHACLFNGQQGVCEISGYCSFPDGSCSSMRRYGKYVIPQLANTCVEVPCSYGETCMVSMTPGQCEVTGHCSISDPTCPSGRRYDPDAGGGFAGQCVNDGVDGGADGGGWHMTEGSIGTVATRQMGQTGFVVYDGKLATAQPLCAAGWCMTGGLEP